MFIAFDWIISLTASHYIVINGKSSTTATELFLCRMKFFTHRFNSIQNQYSRAAEVNNRLTNMHDKTHSHTMWYLPWCHLKYTVIENVEGFACAKRTDSCTSNHTTRIDKRFCSLFTFSSKWSLLLSDKNDIQRLWRQTAHQHNDLWP